MQEQHPMARRANSVIGIDLGKNSYKAVQLSKKSETRYVLTSFASHDVPEDLATPDAVAQQVKQLLRGLGGQTRNCAIAVSEPGSLLRIIEQPSTPPELLRNALRYNGLSMLNQDCKDFVLDVAAISHNGSAPRTPSMASNDQTNVTVQSPVTTQMRYLVGGMLRTQVKLISEAMAKTRLVAGLLQLSPVCSLNAFVVAYPEVHA